MAHTTVSMRAPDGAVVRIECHEALPSVTALAREYAANGYPDRYAVLAERQSRAVSIRGRTQAREEEGLFLSCILRPSLFPSQAGLLPALSAVALASALEEHTERRIGIGWISSIYCEGQQIGGCTVEGKLDDFSTYEYLIVSFHVRMSQTDFPPRLTDMMRKVFESEDASIPAIMAKTVLNKFFTLYPFIKQPSRFMDVYKQKFILRGRQIRYLENGKRVRARVLGINGENGKLVVERRGRICELHAPKGVSLPRHVKL